jgi:hypothetical protein
VDYKTLINRRVYVTEEEGSMISRGTILKELEDDMVKVEIIDDLEENRVEELPVDDVVVMADAEMFMSIAYDLDKKYEKIDIKGAWDSNKDRGVLNIQKNIRGNVPTIFKSLAVYINHDRDNVLEYIDSFGRDVEVKKEIEKAILRMQESLLRKAKKRAKSA